ncbi:MAG: FAD-dependent oxidoreductase [Thermoleophilaceae bacterium]
MAVAAGVLTDTQRRTLEAVCDTFAPSVQGGHDDLTRAYFARSASDIGVAPQVEGLMAQAMLEEEIEAFGLLFDALADNGFADLPLEQRTAALAETRDSSHDAKLALRALKGLTFLFFYALPDAEGRNPNWEALGFPGPVSAPPSLEQAPKTIPIEAVSGPEATLTADAVVVGSGAGGGVIAARIAQAGRSVVVLEMGRYQNEADFNQQELKTLELYLGGGLLGSEDGSMSILAGATLGGGTVVNYMNCIRTPQHIREEWEGHGIEGMGSLEYEQHIDAIWDRLSVNAEATSQNRPHKKLIAALESQGMEHKVITRNTDRECEDPRVCGYCLAGCQKGCKQSTLKTFLQDAADAGARFVVGARADRVLVEDGRAAGVEALVSHADGTQTRLRVDAPTVVVAGGSVESPALLLRSGIGGPAAGKHLRLQPAGVVEGVYEEPIEGWVGQIQSAVSYDFADCEGEYGFLLESAPTLPASQAGSYPFEDGRRHKEDLLRCLRNSAPFISVARDHGEGEVVVDEHGRAVVRWSLDDELDRRMFVRAQLELCRLHRAAGAKEMFTFHSERIWWREGDDFDAFLGRVETASYEAADVVVFSAHQMGSCRMGSDPAESVADGRGQLHDVAGVWIGDASAFPTAPGVNPMISVMALAHRTAGEILRV